MAKSDIETTLSLELKYNEQGLLPAIVQDSYTGDILMIAWVNSEAFKETMDSGYATFWSRSRNELWKKGESSGNMMQIKEILVDCDQDSVIYKVEKALGGACHTKNSKGEYRNSCFYRRIIPGSDNLENLDL